MPKTHRATEHKRPAKRPKAGPLIKGKNEHNAPVRNRVAVDTLKHFLDMPLDIMFEVSRYLFWSLLFH